MNDFFNDKELINRSKLRRDQKLKVVYYLIAITSFVAFGLYTFYLVEFNSNVLNCVGYWLILR
jgi:hypothetical protein